MKANARRAFRRYHRITSKFPTKAIWDAADAARVRLKAAKRTSDFHRVDDLAVVAASIIRAGREGGNCIELPTTALLGVLAGDDEVRGA